MFAPVSREGALVVNNLLLCVAALSVFIGTLYPLALETLTGEKISVGPPYFNLTFGPIMLPLLLLVPLGPFLSWKRADLFGAMQRLWVAALVAAGVALLTVVVAQRGPWLAPFGIALGIWLVAGRSVNCHAHRPVRCALPTRLSRCWGPGRRHRHSLAHAGVGHHDHRIIALSLWKVEVIVAMKPGETAQVGDYAVPSREAPLTGPNYTGETGRSACSRRQRGNGCWIRKNASSSQAARRPRKLACTRRWPAISMW